MSFILKQKKKGDKLSRVNKVTDEEINNYVVDYNSGMSCTEIGKKYGRDKGTVRNKLKEIGVFKRKNPPLSKKEIENIIQYYNDGIDCAEIGRTLGRDETSVRSKLISLGLYNFKYHTFTDDDIEFLKEYYPCQNWDKINERFPNVSKQSIYKITSKYHISVESYYWTDEDIKLLKDNYNNLHGHSDNYIKLFNGRYTYDAITTKAIKLGITQNREWTKDKIDILKSKYPYILPDEMIQYLPNRNKNSIILKANQLGIRNVSKYSKKQVEYIKNHWDTESDEDLAIHINKSSGHCIKQKRLQLGLLHINEYSSYNDLCDFIRHNNYEWKKESMKNCNYKCIITKGKFNDIHHLYGFNLIFNEMLDTYDIDVKDDISDYTEDELSSILEKFRTIQSKYPLGVCLNRDIHRKFHKLYGFGNNTPDQFKDFENKLKIA